MPDKLTKLEEKAFDFASSAIKQVITLSTAVLATTVAVSKISIVNDSKSVLLFIAWIVFIFSIVSGLWALYQLTTQLIKEPCDGLPSITEKSVTHPASVQLVLFIIGLGLIVGYAIPY